MSKDQAAKIVASVCLDPNTEPVGAEVKLQRLIRRAIASAVRKERERCVGIVKESRGTGEMGKYERAYMCDAIAEKINGGKR